MSLDFNSLIGQAQDALNSGVKQIEDQGVPALTAAAETWGANVLQTQAKQNQTALNTAIAKAPAAAPGSFAAALQGTFSSALISQNGPMLILGAIGIFLAWRILK